VSWDEPSERKKMLGQIQPYLSNRLEPVAKAHRWVAGIIGDRPSQYAKSPSLWNPAFMALGLDAIFLPFDVEARNLSSLVNVLRRSERVVGFSVTVPYKVEIINLLDDLDPKARQIGAVNTVARTEAGELVGYNTDGQGFIDMLTKSLPGQDQPFFENIEGLRALLIGAGGAARAVAFFLAENVGKKGRITIANRDSSKAKELATAVNGTYSNASAVPNADLEAVAPTVDLIINATINGQSGIRKLANGRITSLEPYCALAPACPAEFSEDLFASESAFYVAWYQQSHKDIEANMALANRILVTIPKETAFVDLIYSPLESRTLAMARLSGHRVLNGKGMNISQAADGFVNRLMRPHLTALGWDLEDTYRRVFQTMSQVW
jgi:shikimate dehydrogenase